jgi:beta-mannosidase
MGDCHSCIQILLVCEGLDTVANVSVNGKQVGYADNMFRRYHFDVTSNLLVGDNYIEIAFQSAALYADMKAAQYPYDLPSADSPPSIQHGEPHRNMIRKEQCTFSWDW